MGPAAGRAFPARLWLRRTGFSRPGFGVGAPGFGGPGFGGPGPAMVPLPVIVTATLLLDGPADAAHIVQRVSEMTDGAATPPRDGAEFAIGALASVGFVTVDDGVATLTELGRNVLASQGVSSQSAPALLTKVGQAVSFIATCQEFMEVARLARQIDWTGTEEQKQKLEDARTVIVAAIGEAKRSLQCRAAPLSQPGGVHSPRDANITSQSRVPPSPPPHDGSCATYTARVLVPFWRCVHCAGQDRARLRRGGRR